MQKTTETQATAPFIHRGDKLKNARRAAIGDGATVSRTLNDAPENAGKDSCLQARRDFLTLRRFVNSSRQAEQKSMCCWKLIASASLASSYRTFISSS